MKEESQIVGRPLCGIVMLMLICAVGGANAATIMDAQVIPLLSNVTVPHEYAGSSVTKFIPWAMAGMTVSWALFFRRRLH